MPQTTTLLFVVLLAVMAGVALGVWYSRRAGHPVGATSERVGAALTVADSVLLRAQALEVAAEPVLIVGSDGRLVDCNASALAMLDRHRTEVTAVDATALRSLLAPDGTRLDWSDVIASRAPWAGEAHIRLPDGSCCVAQARMVPVFNDRGDVLGMVEAYRAQPEGAPRSAERYLDVRDEGDRHADGSSVQPPDALRRELRHLKLAFTEIDRVFRQYEQLLPALRAEDPVTEAIAGIAAETSEVAASADVPRLLREIPRALDRMRIELQRLTAVDPSVTPGDR